MKTFSPTIIPLPWRPDAAERYFSLINHLPWAMLLHSGHADHACNRFDILVADPLATLVTRGEQTVITDAHGVQTSTDDPFTLVKQAIDNAHLHPQADKDLPFQGGALGLFGYDLGRRFEKLPSCAHKDILLPDMAIGIYDWAIVVDHHQQRVTLLSHQDPQARLDWLNTQTPPSVAPFSLTSSWQANMTRGSTARNFARYRPGCTAATVIRSTSPSVFRRTIRAMNGRLFAA